ncbi:hypothetical protein [Streptomyces sp. NPDC006415]|uniref:hypothetical protein n=1 Tax=Streptomyces sp. NPDC006415 TaxID=3155351 RepID=UPI0033B482CC
MNHAARTSHAPLPGPGCAVPGRTAEHIDDLLVQVAYGSEDALGRLYDLLAPILLALLRTRPATADDAPDALVEVFTGIWRDAPAYTPGPNGLEWVLDRTRERAAV